MLLYNRNYLFCGESLLRKLNKNREGWTEVLCGIGRNFLCQGTERNKTSIVKLEDEQSVGGVCINKSCTLTYSKNKELH